MSCWLIVFISIPGLIASQVFVALFFVGVTVFAGVLAFLGKRFDSDILATIDRDGIHFRHTPTTNWENVEFIRWSPISDHIVIKLRSTKFARENLNLDHSVRSDRAPFIAALRRLSGDIEQQFWPRFCVRYAVRLIESPSLDSQQEEQGFVVLTDEQRRSDSWFVKVSIKLMAYLGEHPFLAGIATPLLMVALLPFLVSRGLWWISAAYVALLTLVLIPLGIGGWPLTVIVPSALFVLFMVVLGFLSPKQAVECPPNGRSVKKLFQIFVAAFVIPAFLILMAAKVIPPPVSEWVFWIVCGAGLIWIIVWSRRPTIRTDAEIAAENAALERWETYERNLFGSVTPDQMTTPPR